MGRTALIMFDIDGTLLQAQLITVPALQETFRAFGLTPPDEARIRATFGAPVEEYEAWLAGQVPGRGAEFVAAANRRELELIGTAGKLYPGVLDTLGALLSHGHTLATCSNGSVAYVDEALDAHRLRPFFSLVRCLGQGFDGKPAMVRDILARIDTRPAFVVGDREGDMAAARANGAVAIAAAYGFGADHELADADASIARIDELPGAIAPFLDATMC